MFNLGPYSLDHDEAIQQNFLFFQTQIFGTDYRTKKVKGGLTEETSMYNSQHKGKFEYLCLPVYKLSFSFFDSLVVS